MSIYEVYMPESEAHGNSITGRGLVQARFLAERASIVALIVPGIWLIWHRLWWALAGYILFAVAIAGLGATQWATATVAFTLLPGIYFLLEGPNWIADKWQREGYALAGLVEADNRQDAELKWLARQDLSELKASALAPLVPPTLQPVGTRVWSQSREDRADFGLFAED